MKLQHITKIYHNKHNTVKALDDISLEINQTGMIFIMGPSGSGKSTLSRIMNGLDRDYTGDFVLEGHIEYVEQDICLFENMPVLDNLELVSKENIQTYLDMFDMSEHKDKLVKNLSVGQKKRVQIIRSLLVDYDYLLLDEPTASLDEENTKIIMNVLKNISQKHTVIIITHEKDLNDQYANRSIYLKEGHVEKDITHHQTSQIILNQTLMNYKNNIQFQFKRILHSLPLQFMKFIVVSIMILTLLIMNSFLFSIEGNIEERNKWLTSDNIIVTQPLDQETQRGDLYDQADIQKVKDNINSVIGYQVGFVASHISFVETLTPTMNLNELKDAIKQEEDRHEQTNEPYKDYYYQWKKILEEELEYERQTGRTLDENFELTSDLRAYDGFTRNENGELLCPLYPYMRFGKNQEVVAYQIFDINTLDLKYGDYPTNSQEVIVSMELAEKLRQEQQLSSVEDILLKSYDLSFIGLDVQVPKIKITGITYQDSQYEHRLFFKAGDFDQLMSKSFKFHDDYLKYVYIYFMTDASKDNQAIADQVNQLLGGKYSTFVAYPDSVLNTSTTPISSYSTLSYVIVGIMVIGVIGIYMLMLILQRKTYNKEVKILKHYHQSIKVYILLPISIILLLDIIIYSLSFDKLCTIINTYVNQQGYSELIQNSSIILILSIVMTIIITLLLEGMFYLYQARKQSKTVTS